MTNVIENIKLNFVQLDTTKKFILLSISLFVIIFILMILNKLNSDVLSDVTDAEVHEIVDELSGPSIISDDSERDILSEFAKASFAKKIEETSLKYEESQKTLLLLITELSHKIDSTRKLAENNATDDGALNLRLTKESAQRKAMLKGIYNSTSNNYMVDYEVSGQVGTNLKPVVSAFDVFSLSRSRNISVGRRDNSSLEITSNSIENFTNNKSSIDELEEELDDRYTSRSKAISRIPAGTIFQARLLAGVDTPTFSGAEESAFPALAVVVGEALAPNGRSYDFKGCHLLVGSYGSLSTERAYFRSTILSCIDESGEIIEVGVESYANGVDGKAGLRGVVVTKDSAIVAKAIASSMWQSIGSALTPAVNPASLTQVTNPYQLPSAAYTARSLVGNGLTQAGDLLTKRYLDIAKNIFPVIEIQAGRIIEFVTLASFDLDPDNSESEEKNKSDET